MAFFLGLLSIYCILWLTSFFTHGALESSQLRGIISTAVMFMMIGISHFAKKEKIEAMIPEGWPFRRGMNYVSGAAEVLLGIGVLYEPTRSLAAIGLLLLLVAIFPANIYVARNKPNLYNISRLFFQPVYMVWVWWFCLHGTA